MGLVAHAETDAWLALSLASYLNLLPLSRQLSCLSGSLWSRTLQARGPAAPEHLPLLKLIWNVRVKGKWPSLQIWL